MNIWECFSVVTCIRIHVCTKYFVYSIELYDDLFSTSANLKHHELVLVIVFMR